MTPLKLLLLSLFSGFLFTGCGRPPSGGGGPPEGDFPVSVVAAPAKAVDLQDTVRLVGSLEASEEVHLLARMQAEVMEIAFGQGDKVESGDLIARLDDARLQARLAEATARQRLAETNFARTERLRAVNTATDQELDEARGALDQANAAVQVLQDELRDTRILAPFSGRLGERLVSVGQVVQPGERIFTLTRLDPLEVRFEVPERFAGALRPGMTAMLRSSAFPEEDFEAEVVFIAPQAERRTRTLPVRARLENPDERLRPGMFARVELVLEERANALVIPEAAVMQRGDQAMVLKQNEEGRAAMQPVRVGLRLDGRVEIREGLREGDIVVVEGLLKARPGVKLAFSAASEDFGLDPSLISNGMDVMEAE